MLSFYFLFSLISILQFQGSVFKIEYNAQPTAYGAIPPPFLADLCPLKDQLQKLLNDIAVRGLEQHQ